MNCFVWLRCKDIRIPFFAKFYFFFLATFLPHDWPRPQWRPHSPPSLSPLCSGSVLRLRLIRRKACFQIFTAAAAAVAVCAFASVSVSGSAFGSGSSLVLLLLLLLLRIFGRCTFFNWSFGTAWGERKKGGQSWEACHRVGALHPSCSLRAPLWLGCVWRPRPSLPSCPARSAHSCKNLTHSTTRLDCSHKVNNEKLLQFQACCMVIL